MKLQVDVNILRVSPSMATEWLSNKVEEQRHVRPAHVDRLASDMNAGRWKISPDAIVRVRGKLANGQHRLMAVARVGKPQSFLVMESNDIELYKVIDSGAKRTVADGLFGVKHSRAVAAISRWVMVYDSRSLSQNSTASKPNATQYELINYCIEHADGLGRAASCVMGLYPKTKLVIVSIAGAVHYICARSGQLDAVEKYLRAIYVDGGNDAAGDVRNRLIAIKNDRYKPTSGYIFGILLKGFKAYTAGKRMNVVKWADAEELPIV